MALKQSSREFFRVVAKAAFSNPFSRERDELDYEIAGLSRKTDNESLMRKVFEKVSAELKELAGSSGLSMFDYEGEDREIVRKAFLFDLFHRFQAELDELIEKQIEAGNKSVWVESGSDIIAALTAFGCTEDQAIRFLCIFYQMRRAYFFIGRGLRGTAPCMIELRRRLWNNVFTHKTEWYEDFLCDSMEDFSTLLLGETGTGKGTVAAAIGRSGYIPFNKKTGCFEESFTAAFVSTNLAGIPQTLIESELFGHKKGAFTGAIDNREGLFGRCSPHGAIFIDEVGDVSADIQVKLLGVLQERAFSPVGSYEPKRFSGRVIAATNKDVDELRRDGEFRDDFFYRLCTDVITVPPLRQRLSEDRSELDTLLTHLLKRSLGPRSAEMTAQIKTVLERDLPKGYTWPGNVRELEQAVRRTLLTGAYEGDHSRSDAPASPYMKQITDGALTAHELMSGYCKQLYEQLGTYEDVAKVVALDRRTVKKYITE